MKFFLCAKVFLEINFVENHASELFVGRKDDGTARKFATDEKNAFQIENILLSLLQNRKIALPLHRKSKNDGGIAQLVRASDS